MHFFTLHDGCDNFYNGGLPPRKKEIINLFFLGGSPMRIFEGFGDTSPKSEQEEGGKTKGGFGMVGYGEPPFVPFLLANN